LWLKIENSIFNYKTSVSVSIIGDFLALFEMGIGATLKNEFSRKCLFKPEAFRAERPEAPAEGLHFAREHLVEFI